MRRTLWVSIAVVSMLAAGTGLAQAREPYKGAIRTAGNSVLFVDAHKDLSGQLNFASGDPAEDDFNVHCDGFDTFEVVDATTVHVTASACRLRYDAATTLDATFTDLTDSPDVACLNWTYEENGQTEILTDCGPLLRGQLIVGPSVVRTASSV